MILATALSLAMWLTPAASQESATRTNQVMTFSYPMDSEWIMHLFPSPLLQANGMIRVARTSLAIDIDILVDDLRPAQSLGGNVQSYVVWLISPDGQISRAGELLQNGSSGMLHTVTNWGAFGIFVTAEPDSCAKCPSGPVVLANEFCADGPPRVRLATIDCRTSTPCPNDFTSLPGGAR